MKRTLLSRRAALRGLAGAAVALPLLETMGVARAQAAVYPNRFAVFFGGHSLGADGAESALNSFAPTKLGRGYDLTPALAPLGTLGVQNEVSVVSNLKIPWAGGGAVPLGGRDNGFHGGVCSPLLSGVRSTASVAICNGPTSDQLVAAALGGATTFKSLAFRAQVSRYAPFDNPSGNAGVMSYRANPAGGAPLPLLPETSPAAAFKALFFNFNSGLTPAQAARRNFLLRARVSVLDLVSEDTARLVPTLGSEDRLRLQRHLDEIRDLERRVSATPPAMAGACQSPGDPGPDPMIGADGTDLNMDQRLEFTANSGYSNEDARARVFCDLIQMAFACDLTRVATLMISQFASAMNAFQFTGVLSDVHFISHGRDGAGSTFELCSKSVAWHVKHFAYLVAKLKGTPEGGGTLLDRCALVYLCEGGRGTDPVGSPGSHSTENMGLLVAGGAGGLKQGKHINGAGRHPAQALVSAINAVGVAGGVGEVQPNLPELFT